MTGDGPDGDRLDRLESVVERQGERIAAQRETIEELRATIEEREAADRRSVDGVGAALRRVVDDVGRIGAGWRETAGTAGTLVLVLAVALASFGAGTSLGTATADGPSAVGSLDATGQVGTADRPLVVLYTRALGGPVVGNQSIRSLLGPGLGVTGRELSAAGARPTVSDGTTTVANASNVTVGEGLLVTDGGNGTATLSVTDASGGGAYDVTWHAPTDRNDLTCSSSTVCTWALANNDKLNLTVSTSIEASGLIVDLAVNNSSAATFRRSMSRNPTRNVTTNDRGNATARLVPYGSEERRVSSDNLSDRTVTVYAVSGGRLAPLVLRIRPVGASDTSSPTITDVTFSDTSGDGLAGCPDDREERISVTVEDPDTSPSDLSYDWDWGNDGNDSPEASGNTTVVCEESLGDASEEVNFTEFEVTVTDLGGNSDSVVESTRNGEKRYTTPGVTLPAVVAVLLLVVVVRRRRN